MELRQRKATTDIEGDGGVHRPVLRRLAQADLFPKPKEDFQREQTSVGAIISCVAAALITSLVLWEGAMYIVGRDAYRTELSVDFGVSGGAPFNFDITFHAIPCHELHVDAMDAAGGEENDVAHDMFKSPVDRQGHILFQGRYNYVERRLGPDGHPVGPREYDPKRDPRSPHFCGNCYIEPNRHHHGYDRKGGVVDRHFRDTHGEACCNTCESVMAMYDLHRIPRPHMNEVEQCITEMSHANPGCNIRGTLELPKARGNIHFAPGRSTTFGPFGQHIHQFGRDDVLRFNVTHTINHFSIGDNRISRFSKHGVTFPLDGVKYRLKEGLGQVRYFLQIVPSTYQTNPPSKFAPEAPVPDQSFEFSVQRFHSEFSPLGMVNRIPSVFFVFDFHPIQINNIFERPPFSRVLVVLCGIVGGLFVIMGLADRAVDSARRWAAATSTLT